MTVSAPSSSNRLHAVLFHLIDEKDRVEFAATYPNVGEPTREYLESLPSIVTEVPPEQRLMYLAFCYVYCLSLPPIEGRTARLRFVQDYLGLTDHFGALFKQYIDPQVLRTITVDKPGFRIFKAPSPTVVASIKKFVLSVCRDGSLYKKLNLTGLSTLEYEHPLDRQAVEALNKTPGLQIVVRKMSEYGLERFFKVMHTGSNILVTDKNLPQVYGLLKTACDTINCHPIPELYIQPGEINAFTVGIEKPIIVLSSGAVSLLSSDELLFVIGHELGHVKSRHFLYHTMSQALPLVGGIAGSATLGLGDLMAKGIQLALLNWYRKSEFTADRAGLLACQNVDAAITAMMKIGGFPVRYYRQINPAHFVEQAKAFQDFDDDRLDKAIKLLSELSASHPWTVLRAAEMLKWVEGGSYQRVLDRKTVAATRRVAAVTGPLTARFCSECGSGFEADELFCMECGAKRVSA